MKTESIAVSHTPGPWLDLHGEIRTRFDNPRHLAAIICDPYAGRTEQGAPLNIDEREANARLIAAAPELLQALKDAESELTKILSSRLLDSTSAPFHSIRRIRDGLAAERTKAEGSK